METVSERNPVVPTPRWLRGRRRYAIALLGAVLFFTPGVARLFGVYPTKIENRPLVAFPHLSDGFGAFAILTQWSIDHLPMRNLAIKADAKISEDIFGEPPTYTLATGPVGVGQSGALQGGRAGATTTAGVADQIVPGRDGWLFLGDEFLTGCRPQLTLAQATAGIRRLDAMITSSGRKFEMLIPPDKDTVDGRFVEPGGLDVQCSNANKAVRWKTLDALGLSDFTDLRSALAAEERATGRPSYLPIDSHWTSRTAATVFLPAILRALSPSLYRSAKVSPVGPVSYIGDLSVLNGVPQHASDTEWNVVRPGVAPGRTTTTSPFANFPITRYLNYSRPGVPLVRGRTLLYGDSFTERSLGIIAPFFANLTRIPEISRAAVEGPEARAAAIADLVKDIVNSDVVIVEQSERIVLGSTSGSILAPDVLDAIQHALAQAPRGHGLSVS
jgi:hypothetical protein